jgi:serine/threonine protein kinase
MMKDVDRIIKFFLHIFQLQTGGSEDAEGTVEYRLVSLDSDPLQIYELRVKLLSGWKTRRMSIRKIGESVESKSTCYVVTYDDLLVVKIPPSPLTDFNRYMSNINTEIGVARMLAPRIYCVTPSLSSILQKVPEISGKIPEDAADVEAACVDLVLKEPRYQGYLKVGDRFSYFMSLSKSPFFDQVIRKIHGDKIWLQEEIFKNSRPFQSLEAFEAVYGIHKVDLYNRFNSMLKDFSRKIDAMLALYGGESPVPDYQKQEWMLAELSEKEIHYNLEEFPQEFCEDIRNLLSAQKNDNKEFVNDFRKTIAGYIRKKNFDKNKSRIEALIINILELIYRLKQSGVAVRDLKPDNILIQGDDSDVYAHLVDPEKYNLGLIDLETAVEFHQEDLGQFRQPMLAGTSVYMTPSHIFRNHILQEIFGKAFSRIFYMQDWFSAIGMVYDVVKGKWLFKKTSRLIPEIVRARERGKKNNIPVSEIFINISRTFWKTAEEELSDAIQKDKEKFQAIHLMLPDHIVDMFKEEIDLEKAMIKRLIYDCATKYFSKNAHKFIDASYDEIKTQRIKWEKSKRNGPSSADISQNAIDQIRRIETLKLKLTLLKGIEKTINPPVTGEDLMKFMLQRVSNAMNVF